MGAGHETPKTDPVLVCRLQNSTVSCAMLPCLAYNTQSKMFKESRLSGVLYINNSVLYINKLSVLVFSVLSVVKLSLVLHW